MANRIVSGFERGLTTTVNDIEHIESQTLRGTSVVKVFFQPGAKIEAAIAQITAISQIVAASDAAGHARRRSSSRYNASSVPILQLGAVGQGPVRAAALRLRRQLHPHAARDRAGRVDPATRTAASSAQIQVDLDPRGAAGQGPVADRRRQRDQRAEPDPARRHVEDRRHRVRRRA